MRKPSNIPISPGVYFFLSRSNKPLYIGKAANLRNRISSYFLKGNANPRIEALLNEARKIIWQKTKSDIEALILESMLIKQRKPKYNIMMRDGKRYIYVGITKEVLPKILTTHQPIQPSPPKAQIRYIGPFTDAGVLRSALKTLRKIFPYCTCRTQHSRECLNSHIKKCAGFCCMKNGINSATKRQISQYKKNINAVITVLMGRRTTLIKKLENTMKQYANKGKFEEAANARDHLRHLQRVFENAKIVSSLEKRPQALGELKKRFNLADIPYRIEGYDISNIQGKYAVGSMVVFEQGNPAPAEYRIFKIRSKQTPDDTAMIKEVLSRRINHPEWNMPDIILIDGGKGQLSAAYGVVGNKIPIISMAKGNKEIFSTIRKTPVKLSSLPKSLRELIAHIDSEAHRFAIKHYRKLHRKTIHSAHRLRSRR